MFFWRENKKVTREEFSRILEFWAWNKNSAREKNWKTPKKYPWKLFFARENFRKITPVKPKIVRVKKINNSASEKWKSARENQSKSDKLMLVLIKRAVLKLE